MEREFFNNSPGKFMYRCLPLNIANSNGWFLLTDQEIKFTCDGSSNLGGIQITSASPLPSSHFGCSILTFAIPFSFSTEKGYDLLIRGPSNLPINWGSPLEGIVETDNTLYVTATMNWVITKYNEEICIPKDFPYAMITPVAKTIESFEPKILPYETMSEEQQRGHREWNAKRMNFNRELKIPDTNANKEKWQKDYMLGTEHAGQFDSHKTKLKLKEFTTY